MTGPDGVSDADSTDLAVDTSIFGQVYRGSTDAIVTVDEAGTVVFANPAVEDVFGHAPADLVGRPLTDLVPDRLRERHRRRFERYCRTEERTLDWDDVEFPGLCADGTEVPLSVSLHEHGPESVEGDDRLFTGVMREITERREGERRLRTGEPRLREVFEASPVALSVRSTDGDLLLANDRADELLDALGDSGDADLYGPDGEPLSADEFPYRLVLETGAPIYDTEFRIDEPDGRQHWFLVDATPVRDEDGEVTQIVTAGKEVTDLRRSQRAVERERADLQSELGDVLDR